jgi:hypothetical protein
MNHLITVCVLIFCPSAPFAAAAAGNGANSSNRFLQMTRAQNNNHNAANLLFIFEGVYVYLAAGAEGNLLRASARPYVRTYIETRKRELDREEGKWDPTLTSICNMVLMKFITTFYHKSFGTMPPHIKT